MVSPQLPEGSALSQKNRRGKPIPPGGRADAWEWRSKDSTASPHSIIPQYLPAARQGAACKQPVAAFISQLSHP